jgi:predicted nucleic acid-binding protein
MYLDASILVALLREEADSERALNLIKQAETPLAVSDLAAGEVASAFSRLVRTSEIEKRVAVERLEAFDDWRAAATEPVEIRAQDVRLAARLVRRFELGLRMPDAIHIALCQSLDLPLATFDERLAWTAEALGIGKRR